MTKQKITSYLIDNNTGGIFVKLEDNDISYIYSINNDYSHKLGIPYYFLIGSSDDFFMKSDISVDINKLDNKAYRKALIKRLKEI